MTQSNMQEITYLASFPLNEDHGYKKATAEKIEALKNIGYNVKTMTPGYTGKNFIVSIICMLFLELRSGLHALFSSKDRIFLIRGFVGFLPMCACRVRGMTACREVHADLAEESGKIFSGIKRFLAWCAGIYCRLLDRMANVLIFNHPNLMDAYAANRKVGSKQRMFWQYNGVNLSKFSGKDLPAVTTPERPYMLFVGNVSRWHGLEKALDLYLSNKNIRDAYEFVIVGPLYDEEAFRQYRVDGISFVGAVPNTEVQSWIADAKACLLPVNPIRISPGSPLKLYEYMAHGKPVITQADTKGYSDVVSEFSAGISIDFDDHQESGEKIFQFLQNCPVDSQKMKATVKDSCSWEAVMRRWMSAIGQQNG